MIVYDSFNLIKSDSDKDVIRVILSLDTNISIDGVKNELYKNNDLEHESIDALYRSAHKLQDLFGWNLKEVIYLTNKLLVR